MKDYLNSKLYLFNKLIKKKGDIITDENIPQKKILKNISFKRNVNFNLIFNRYKGIELVRHKYENERQLLEIRYKNKNYIINLNLIGKIQIKNIFMAILAAHKSGLEFNKIIDVIHKIKPVEGRLEKIGKIKNRSKVVLDYAHTPNALEIALLNLKGQFPSSKINLVFGCGGERDFKKRSMMGKIAATDANILYKLFLLSFLEKKDILLPFTLIDKLYLFPIFFIFTNLIIEDLFLIQNEIIFNFFLKANFL